MGRLIAVEGLDGAGKNTLVTGLVRRWQEAGSRVSTFTFPRYGQSVFADIAAEALHGEHGDLRSSVYAMAMLFALDRQSAAPAIESALAENDVVIADRYVASNAAYSAARLGEPADGAVVTWITDTEFGRFALPKPAHHLLIGIPAEIAMARAAARAEADPGRGRDLYERDSDLQLRVDQTYRDLAAASWIAPWTAVTGDDVDSLATQLLE